MQFAANERQILEDKGYFEGTRKILLTNNRIIFFKKKGFFGDFNLLEREIRLTDISECTLEKSSLEGNKIKIQLKNGKSHFLIFPAKLSALAFGSIYDFGQTKSSITDKWLLAINQQIQKNIQENPLNTLQLRFAKGEISKSEYEEMKQVLKGEKRY